MSDNLNNILAGFNGVVAVIGETVALGGPVGKNIVGIPGTQYLIPVNQR
jgi:hypothetical protein